MMYWAALKYQDKIRFGYRIGQMIQLTKLVSLKPVMLGEHFADCGSPLSVDGLSYRIPFIPGKVICICANYLDHCKETNSKPPKEPIITVKLNSALTIHERQILWSRRLTSKVDYEAELGIVIGKPAHFVSEENSLDHIFGYVVANDVTARDIQQQDGQWVRAKSLDGFGPISNFIATRDEIQNPQNVEIRCFLNDILVQKTNTNRMIFDVPYLISYLSRSFPLETGDLILTGTPSGTGAGRKPQKWLQSGDKVSIYIEGVGALTNTFFCRD